MTHLTDREGDLLEHGTFQLQYDFSKDKTVITAKLPPDTLITDQPMVVLPIVSKSGEKVTQATENRIEIKKDSGMVVVESNVPISIKKTKKERVFNMVPGMEALPIQAFFENDTTEIVCTVTVI
jgi:hypothetical protein